MGRVRWLVSAATLGLLVACSGDPAVISVTGKVSLDGESDHSGVLIAVAGRSTLTDKEGTWRIELLKGGTYVVQAAASDTLEGTKTLPVEVPDEGTASTPDIQLTPVGQVEGRVTRGSATGNAGISVIAVGSSSSAVTDDTGSYLLRNVPTGSRTLEVTAPGYALGRVQVQVSRSGRVAAGALTLARSSQPYRGVAKLLGVNTHAGTVVTVEGTDRTATTSATGEYSLDAPDGVYTLSFRNGSYELTVPNVVFSQGSPYIAEDGLRLLPPVVLPQAKQLSRARSVGVPAPFDIFFLMSNFLQQTVDGSGFAFIADTSYQVFIKDVAYGGGFSTNSNGTLRFVSATGGNPLTLGTGVSSFKFTSDGSRVLFLGADGALYSGNLTSGEVVPLGSVGNLDPIFGGNTSVLYMSSPQGSRVAFLKSGSLYVGNSAGGTSTLLGANVGSSAHNGFAEPGIFSADGSRLFFGGASGLMVADLRSGIVQSTGPAAYPSYQVTPDRSVAVALTSKTLTLTRLSPSTSTTSVIEAGVSEFLMAADGSRVAYWIDASPPVLKQMSLPSGIPGTLGTNARQLLSFSADSRQLLMTEHDVVSGNHTYSLVSYDLTSPARRLLWSGTGNEPSLARFSGNGAFVVFRIDSTLYAVSSTGSGLRSLATSSACCSPPTFSPINDRVAFLSDVGGIAQTLQVAPLASGTTLTLGRGVSQFEFTPDGSRVVLLEGDVLRLNSALTGANESVLGQGVRSFSLSPDGTAVVLIDITGLARVVKLATGESRALAERVTYASWVDAHRLALIRANSPTPFGFLDGLYLANVP